MKESKESIEQEKTPEEIAKSCIIAGDTCKCIKADDACEDHLKEAIASAIRKEREKKYPNEMGNLKLLGERLRKIESLEKKLAICVEALKEISALDHNGYISFCTGIANKAIESVEGK